jgi:hypothetical protein
MARDILDLKPQWLNVARRLQQCAACSGNLGVAIVSTSILIDDNGLPVGFSEPRITKIDPKGNKDLLITMLSGKG